jgi:hypothetical protein
MTFLPHINRNRIVATATALVTALAVLLSAAQSASAHHRSVHSFPNFMGAAQTAIQAWNGYLDHCTQMTVYGYDSAEEPDYADAYAFAPMNGCEVYFNVDQRKNYNWKWFCSVMVHEMGHSAGMRHIRDGRDIMHATNEVYWRWCLTKRQARKMKRRHEIIDKSIWSWAYAKASLAKFVGVDSHDEHGHPDHDDLTRSDVDQAVDSGALVLDPMATIPIR